MLDFAKCLWIEINKHSITQRLQHKNVNLGIGTGFIFKKDRRAKGVGHLMGLGNIISRRVGVKKRNKYRKEKKKLMWT